MRSRTSDWFETKIRYDKTMEDGTQKKVTEQYVVDALSFTEAENTIIEEMSSYISGDFKITDIKPAPYHEIFFSDMENDDKWYKTKLQFITIDEKTEKEKRSNVNYLVQAGSLEGAVKHIGEVMGTTMNDYAIASIAETMPILKAQGAVDVLGLVVSVDRCERGQGEKSALQEVSEKYGMKTCAIVTMKEVVEHLWNRPYKGKVIIDDELKGRIDDYYRQYGVREA